VRRAQEAAADARWLAGHRALVDSENARYGHYSIRDGADELTPEQQEARYRRKRAEGRQAAQREASRQYQIANKDRELTPYEQQQKDRRAAVAARAQLAGGSQNLNSGNSATINALLALDPEDRQDALRQMLPINPMRAQVEAAHNAQLTQLGLRVAQGQGFQTDPLAAAQGAAAQQQVEAGKPLVQRAQEAGAAGRFNDPDIFAHADEMVHNHYSSRPGVLGVSTHFTDNEVAIGAQRLADELDIPFEEAEKVMRRIQQDRNRNRPASTVASWMYDQ
jgi:hypothetical protein